MREIKDYENIKELLVDLRKEEYAVKLMDVMGINRGILLRLFYCAEEGFTMKEAAQKIGINLQTVRRYHEVIGRLPESDYNKLFLEVYRKR